VLGVERFGTINFAQNIVQFFLFIAMMGITHIGVREIAKQTNQQDRSRCYSSMLGLNLIYTALALAIYFPLICFFDRFVEQQTLFLLGGLQILFTTFTVEWFFRGTEDFRYITIRNITIKILYIISVFIFVHEPSDYITFFLLTVLVTIVNAIINYTYARKRVQFSWRMINLKKYFRSSLSLGGYTLLTSIYTTFNVAFLGLIWDDKQVGYYTTALKLYTIILGFYSAFTSVMLPRMTSILGNGDEKSFYRLINKSFELLYIMALPMVVVLFILAPELITLLAGDAYTPSIRMSRIVVPMLFIVGIAQVLAFQVLIPKGYDKYILKASIIGAIVGVLSNLILTTKFAAIGTCISVVLTEISVTSYYCVVTIKNKLISIDKFLLKKNLIASLPYAFLCILPQFFCRGSIIGILLISVVFCVAYFFLSQIYILKDSLVLSVISSFKQRKQL